MIAVRHAIAPLRLLLLAFPLLAGCRTQQNYRAPEGPRYAGAPTASASATRRSDTLRIVSFNIAYSVQIDSAIAVLSSEPALRSADIILLQEMDEVGTRRIADAFRMWHVYYPATLHLRTKRGFGNAILSRWPIIADSKIVLPRVSLVGRTQRTATAATIQFGSDQIRVYSTHLSTPFDVTPGARRTQLRSILEDAEKFNAVIIGGDMNSASIGKVARHAGYAWPTERGPRTTRGGRWDHIFFKGLKVPAGTSAGTITDVRGSSDHSAIWAVGAMR